MTRAEHYLEAERLIGLADAEKAKADKFASLRRNARDDAHMLYRAAQVHATLACARDVPPQPPAESGTQANWAEQLAQMPDPISEPVDRPKPVPPQGVRS